MTSSNSNVILSTPAAINLSHRPIVNTLYGWTAVLAAFCLPLFTSASDFLFLLGALLFVITGQWLEKIKWIYKRPALLGLCIVFAWMLFAVTYTSAPLPDAFLMLLKYSKLLSGLVFIPVFIEEKWRHYTLNAFLIAIIITLIAAILKEIGFFIPTTKDFGHLLVFKDHIQTSFLMAIAAYFSAILYSYSPKRTIMRKFYGLLLISTVLCLFSIEGRSGYVVFFALLFWFSWRTWHWHGLWIGGIASVFLITVAYGFSPAFKERVQESKHDVNAYQVGQTYTSIGLRAEFIKNSWHLVKQHPLLGSGTGSFTSSYASAVKTAIKTHNPHNQYLHILVQWGAIGLLLLLAIFYQQWRDSNKLSLCTRDMIQGVLIAIAIGSLANSWLLDTTEGHFYSYFITWAFASSSITVTKKSTKL